MGIIDLEKNTHGIALTIENLMTKYVNSEKLCGRGGVLNADFIENYPYIAIMCSLFYVAGNDPDRCDDYINEFMKLFRLIIIPKWQCLKYLTPTAQLKIMVAQNISVAKMAKM